MQYAVPVWQKISVCFSDRIESVQRRALQIIFPSADSCSEALQLAHLDTLA